MHSKELPAEYVGYINNGKHVYLFSIKKLKKIIKMTIAKKKIFCENAIFQRKTGFACPAMRV